MSAAGRLPRRFYLETTSECNARCVMCPHPHTRRGLGLRLPTEVFQRLVDEIATFPGVTHVNPFNNNEPLADRRLSELIAYIRSRMPAVRIRLFSNGSLMTGELGERLVRSGLDAITFSLHAATERTYRQVMGLAAFDRTRARVAEFCRAHGSRVKVRVTIVDLHLTRPEAEATTAYWRGLGVDAYVVRAVNWAGNLRDEEALPIYEYEGAFSACHRVMDEMYVSASGKAILCCADWREEVVMGDASRETLASIWEGPRYREYRRRHTAGQLAGLTLCSVCTYAHRRVRRPPAVGEL